MSYGVESALAPLRVSAYLPASVHVVETNLISDATNNGQ